MFANAERNVIDKLKDSSDNRLFVQNKNIALNEYKDRSTLIDKTIFSLLKNRSRVLKSYALYGDIEERMSSLGMDVSSLEYRPFFKENKRVFKCRKISGIGLVPKYDYVILDSYIEHQYCPYLSITEAVSIVKETGTIFILVPVNNNPISNLRFRSHEFTQESLDLFLKRTGLPYTIQVLNNTSICSVKVR